MYAVLVYNYKDNEMKVNDIRKFILHEDAKKYFDEVSDFNNKVELVKIQEIESIEDY